MSKFLKSGGIPDWRIIFWIVVAMTCLVVLNPQKNWKMNFIAIPFCTVLLGVFFFALNWTQSDRVQQNPNRLKIGLLLISLGLLVSLLKFWWDHFHK
jgi:hypothetical protein